ncbi:MAG: hypothetical protein WC613_04140, partial [Candidatus Aenigmatarchaeota archaeon]
NATTGLFGYTVNLCNTTANCYGMACFTDYDGTGTAGSAGWCNMSTTSCYHDNGAYATTTSICYTNTTYYTCSSGNWSSLSTCSSGQTCASVGSAGSCATPSTTTSSTSGSSYNLTQLAAQRVGSIIFTSRPIDFSMIQGNSETKYALIKNNGNVTLYNLTLSVSGLSWYSVDPAKIDRSIVNNETTFMIVFSAPADAEIKTYPVTISVSSNNASASAVFNINLNPSNTTIQEKIFPDYANYMSMLEDIETTMKDKESQGANIQEMQALLLNAKSKLTQANRSIESKDYASATNFLADAKGLLDEAALKINTITVPLPQQQTKIDIMLIVIIASIAVIVGVFVYLLLPPKDQQQKSWLPDEKKKKKFFDRFKKKDNKLKW